MLSSAVTNAVCKATVDLTSFVFHILLNGLPPPAKTTRISDTVEPIKEENSQCTGVERDVGRFDTSANYAPAPKPSTRIIRKSTTMTGSSALFGSLIALSVVLKVRVGRPVQVFLCCFEKIVKH